MGDRRPFAEDIPELEINENGCASLDGNRVTDFHAFGWQDEALLAACAIRGDDDGE